MPLRRSPDAESSQALMLDLVEIVSDPVDLVGIASVAAPVVPEATLPTARDILSDGGALVIDALAGTGLVAAAQHNVASQHHSSENDLEQIVTRPNLLIDDPVEWGSLVTGL